jgi:protein-disulfide isomerase
MSNKTKPILVIVVAVVAAAGIALYLSHQSAAPGPGSGGNLSSSGGGHVRGNPSAPVTLVEFGDYQCPSCGYYHPIVDELIKRYPDKVKLEFHHYPLVQMHANALEAAMAVEAASDQGKFWEMHDLIYDHQKEWDRLPNPDTQFLAFAGTLGLDSNKFMRSLKSRDVQDRILADIQRGSAAKVQGTPTFFIDGQALDPTPNGVDEFAAVVNTKLQASK